MDVNRTGGITITLTDDEASALASVLGGVADNTKGGKVEFLFNRLLDLHVLPVYTVSVEENPVFDPEDEFDPFSHNIVITDPLVSF